MLSPEIMRVLLTINIIGLALIALLYLRRRKLSPAGYLGWGVLLLLLPVLGPLLVIAAAPGKSRLPTRQASPQANRAATR